MSRTRGVKRSLTIHTIGTIDARTLVCTIADVHLPPPPSKSPDRFSSLYLACPTRDPFLCLLFLPVLALVFSFEPLKCVVYPIRARAVPSILYLFVYLFIYLFI